MIVCVFNFFYCLLLSLIKNVIYWFSERPKRYQLPVSKNIIDWLVQRLIVILLPHPSTRWWTLYGEPNSIRVLVAKQSLALWQPLSQTETVTTIYIFLLRFQCLNVNLVMVTTSHYLSMTHRNWSCSILQSQKSLATNST